MKKEKILSFSNVKTQFHVRGKILNTIRGIDFDIYDNELVAIVGESGSGKSVLTKTLTSMLDSNGYVKSGRVFYYPNENSRNDEVTNFKEPIDLIDIHKSIVPQSSKNAFIKVMLKQINKLKKELLIIEKLVAEDVEDKLVSLNEKLEKETDKFKSFSRRNKSHDKLEKIKNEIRRYVFFKNILDSEEFKNENIESINKRIKKLTGDLHFYKKFPDHKKQILSKISNVYSQYIENGSVDKESVEAISTEIKNQEVLYDYEEKIILLNEQLLNNKVDKDELHIIINKAKLRSNSDRANKKFGTKRITKLRGGTVAVIPQDPMTSLNPLLSVGFQISEVLRKHEGLSRKQAKEKAIELLEEVGIPNPKKRYKDIPGEYSGGMRQRVVIAIALACTPKILVCDEPTTALDVTVQANILKLIKTLQNKHKFTTIFITHDLGVVANIADRVAVMYAGQIIEYGTTKEIFYNPQHPYTWALLSSLPQLGEKGEDLYTINGNPPSLKSRIDGDAFAPRNEFALEIDFLKEPPLTKVTETHYAKTWLLDKRAPKVNAPKKIVELKKKLKG